MNHPPLSAAIGAKIKPEVQEALAEGRPVVALESTIIAHGLPSPHNVAVALDAERVIREAGAVPATIAVFAGCIKIGLTQEEIYEIAVPGSFPKLSSRDLPSAIAAKQNGAMTVSATIAIARILGIRVFATGGIGGVHRGATETMDISSDLTELARSQVAVVCAGSKVILDIGLTLEYLETLGVPVIGYRADSFPAFYYRDSGFPVPCRADTPHEVARTMRAAWAIGLQRGLLIANPIPAERELDPKALSVCIAQASDEARTKGIRGKEITPYLLRRLAELTCGETIRANTALYINNARLAAQIACAFCELDN